MSAHDHREYVEGCYRCDIGRDEAQRAEADDLWPDVLRLDDATWVALRELADQDGRTISDLVREAIATYLDTPK